MAVGLLAVVGHNWTSRVNTYQTEFETPNCFIVLSHPTHPVILPLIGIRGGQLYRIYTVGMSLCYL